MQSLSSDDLQMPPQRFRDLMLPDLNQPVPAAAPAASPRSQPAGSYHGKPSPAELFATTPTAATAVGATLSSYMRQPAAASSLADGSPAGSSPPEPNFDDLLDPRNWDRNSRHRDSRQGQPHFETHVSAPMAVRATEPYVDRPLLNGYWPMQPSAGAHNDNVCSGEADAALNLSNCNRRFMAHSHKRTFRGSGSGQVTKRHSMDPLLETSSHALSRCETRVCLTHLSVCQWMCLTPNVTYHHAAPGKLLS